MKIDFHTHGKLAKKLPLSIPYLEAMLQGAIQAGLDGLCLTEHFNTVGFEQLYRHVATYEHQEMDCFTYKGLKIFPGMEVDVREGVHILVLGEMETIIEFNQALEPYKEKGQFIGFKALVSMAQARGCYLGAAHPYREGSEVEKIDATLLNAFDFLDMNGKDIAYGGEAAIAKVIKLGERLQVPVVMGSDTHQLNQYGCVYNEVSQQVTTLSQLMTALQANQYERCRSLDIREKIDLAVAMKIKLKALHEEGVDYVAYLGTCLA